MTSVSQLLKFSVCVKNCPNADPTTQVNCKIPSFMLSMPNYYKNCQFYVGGITDGGITDILPLRYET